MDIRMPVMNGFEALQAIRNELGLADLPVVAVTASVMKHDLHKLENEFNGVLEKPLNRSILISTLKKYLPFSSENTIQKVTDTIIENIQSEELVSLFDQLVPQSKELLKLGDMMAIGTFAESVIEDGKQYRFEPLIEWGERLRVGSEGFEINQVESQLRNFETTLQTWGITWKAK